MLNSYEMACKTAQNFLSEFLKKYVGQLLLYTCTSSCHDLGVVAPKKRTLSQYLTTLSRTCSSLSIILNGLLPN